MLVIAIIIPVGETCLVIILYQTNWLHSLSFDDIVLGLREEKSCGAIVSATCGYHHQTGGRQGPKLQ